VECAGLRPGVRVLAIERDGASCERIATNAASHGVSLEVVTGEAPGVLAELPTPDRLFIGGGGFDVLDAALDRLAPGGVAVATYTSWERGRVAAERLGNIVEVTVRRGERKEDGDWGRISLNPVFVVWGTR
ncbi:MAG: cobalamin biosynthesis bifunctional protein CbiET, partial [Acidimicrobiales bacterium]